jgi:predicted RNase H-like HicB family nuclease
MAKKIAVVKTKYGSFRCIFESEKDTGGYTVESFGAQGAISWGKTLAEAKQMIVEAIEGAIEARAIAEAEKRGIIRVNKQKNPISVA